MDKGYLKNECLKRVEIANREELLYELSFMEMLISGRTDVWFCNYFLSEAVQLLINSIFLMEDGYFDCAFYSIRQSSETMNNMLLLASDKAELKSWKAKDYFPTDKKVKKRLKAIDSTYQEIREKLAVFFDEFDTLIEDSNKIIHKQGFDSFYKLRRFQAKEIGFSKESEIKMFDKLIRYSICRLYIFFIILDPVGLILADDDLDNKFNFAPMTEAIHLDFIADNYHVDLVALIKETEFYKDLVRCFAEKDEMNEYVYNVIREQYFDLEHLDQIRSQIHLLNGYEQFILCILIAGLQVSEFYVGGNSIFPYRTSIASFYKRSRWSVNEFDNYIKVDNEFNNLYNGVYLSCISMYGESLVLQHNEPLKETEIILLSELTNHLNEQYAENTKNCRQ